MADSSGEQRKRHLMRSWHGAIAGSRSAQEAWQVVSGGPWTWQHDGILLQGHGEEWSELRWHAWSPLDVNRLTNFVLEVTVSGEAEAVGIGFGPFKDFLIDIAALHGARRLQFEVDVPGDRIALRADGQLMDRTRWDVAVMSVADLAGGVLSLKARHARQVFFHDLSLHLLDASCQLSVIIVCNRFLQRLRVVLRNWCHQTVPTGAHELLIVNPGSPDGTHEHLAAVARSYPGVRLRELPVGPNYATNKGAMINHAVAASQGNVIWLTDADCLFSTTSAAQVLAYLEGREQRLFYGQRRHLSPATTDALLSGRLDGVRQWSALSQSADHRPMDNVPIGYTQVVHRPVIERLRYRDDINHFARSDEVFRNDCKRHRIVPEQIDGLVCLHLDHPFAWYGTSLFL
jgi:hypothetical protein